jgi:hypothetical protein
MPSIPTISRQPLPAYMLVVAVALGGCSIKIEKPANNAVITLPATTKVAITGNASYTGLMVMVDGGNVSSQIVSTGSSSSEGDIGLLAAGPHTVSASATLSCWYCSGGTTLSTDTRSFIVIPGTHVCAREAGGTPVITLDANVVTVGQRPGQQLIAYKLLNGSDVLLIIVDDAPGLTPIQMRVALDLDPFNGVTSNKTVEAWGFCRSGSRVAVVEASMLGGFNVGVACASLTPTNGFSSGCTNTQTMLLLQSTTSELWLRKPGFLGGFWYDAEAIDASIWQAFGGRSVRFIWRHD